MKGKEVNALRPDEVKVELARLRGKLYELRTKSVTEKIEDTSQFGKIRRDIARLLTRQRAVAGGASK
jgi:ribosomal protein L29